MGKLIIFLAIIILGIGFSANWLTNHLPDQNKFSNGTVPDPALHGKYDGEAFLTGFWKGMEFDSNKSTGDNLIRSNGKIVSKYNFKTYVGKDIQNTSQNVLKLDYGVSGNPFWFHFISEVVVQTTENQYLGKIYVTLLPSTPLAISFFHFTKEL